MVIYEIFPLRHRFQTSSGAHPASYTMDTGDSYLAVKRSDNEADHSPPSMPRLGMRRAIPSLSNTP